VRLRKLLTYLLISIVGCSLTNAYGRCKWQRFFVINIYSGFKISSIKRVYKRFFVSLIWMYVTAVYAKYSMPPVLTIQTSIINCLTWRMWEMQLACRFLFLYFDSEEISESEDDRWCCGRLQLSMREDSKLFTPLSPSVTAVLTWNAQDVIMTNAIELRNCCRMDIKYLSTYRTTQTDRRKYIDADVNLNAVFS